MLLASRFEYKYIIHRELVPAIRNYMQPFVRPDAYAIDWPEYRYPINSLYLDSPDLALYLQTLHGHKNRYKLRVRGYTTNHDDPIFFEIKRRVNVILLKTRAKLPRQLAWDLLQGRTYSLYDLDPATRENAEKFLRLVEDIQAEPIAYVYYQREAYESIYDDPVRITFDSDLAYGMMAGEDLAFDNPIKHVVPMEGVVLEIKFTEVFPDWVRKMVQHFGLSRTIFAKYVNCVEHALEHDLYRYPVARRI